MKLIIKTKIRRLHLAQYLMEKPANKRQPSSAKEFSA
jgi:hypothetical protein